MTGLDLLQAPPIYRQIVAKFEDDIFSGRLKVGERIPSTTELAREFGVGRNAVQRALGILADRGLVERHVKRGTFVREQVGARTLGVLFGHNIVAEQYSQFLRLVYSGIVKKAAEAGWRVELYFPATKDGYSLYVSQIERDIVRGYLQAVINFDKSDLMSECLRSGGCPSIEYSMVYDKLWGPEESVLYRGVEYLLERGFRDIAIVGATKREVEKCATYFNEVRGSAPALEHFVCRRISERGGVEVCGRILSVGKRFDAALVLNDTICRGVIFHLMESGVRIPADLAVMAMTNKGHEVLSPVPLTRIEWNPEMVAENNLNALFAKISGMKPKETGALAPALIIGESCGETFSADTAA